MKTKRMTALFVCLLCLSLLSVPLAKSQVLFEIYQFTNEGALEEIGSLTTVNPSSSADVSAVADCFVANTGGYVHQIGWDIWPAETPASNAYMRCVIEGVAGSVSGWNAYPNGTVFATATADIPATAATAPYTPVYFNFGDNYPLYAGHSYAAVLLAYNGSWSSYAAMIIDGDFDNDSNRISNGVPSSTCCFYHNNAWAYSIDACTIDVNSIAALPPTPTPMPTPTATPTPNPTPTPTSTSTPTPSPRGGGGGGGGDFSTSTPTPPIIIGPMPTPTPAGLFGIVSSIGNFWKGLSPTAQGLTVLLTLALILFIGTALRRKQQSKRKPKNKRG